MENFLVVDDEENIRKVLKQLLEKNGYKNIFQAKDGLEALGIIENENIDVIISDINMPNLDGLQLYEKVKKYNMPFIILTAYGTIETAVNAIKSGVYDFISKPFNESELISTIKKALSENKSVNKDIVFDSDMEAAFFNSKNFEINSIKENLQRVAKTNANILVLGETGAGKGLLANAIHGLGNEKSPFIKVNCAAIPENLIESELFGYVKGAFTGALIDKPGKFEIASGGTLFLDEIGELNNDLQAKLLNAIQDKEITRIGDVMPRKIDVRIIAATNVDIKKAIQEKKFREDLYYRLNIIEFNLPPLRQRKDDIFVFIDFFNKKYSMQYNLLPKKFTDEAISYIKEYSWPGNIRELENVIQKTIILESACEIDTNILEKYIKREENIKDTAETMFDKAEQEKIKKEIEIIKEALLKTGGNRTKAAELLGISRRTLLYRIKEYKL